MENKVQRFLVQFFFDDHAAQIDLSNLDWSEGYC